MKNLFAVTFLTIGITASSISCTGATSPWNGNKTEIQDDRNITAKNMKITIGSRIFTATLYNNPTVTKLKAMLPLTLDMSELNGNEKYFHFSTNLPANHSKPGTIRTGDLMLWGPNSLVLFYESFETSYSYTKLGRIENASGLAAAVGAGMVKVTFELN